MAEIQSRHQPSSDGEVAEPEDQEEEEEEQEEEQGDEVWTEGDPVMHPDRLIIVPRHPLPQGHKAYVYVLMVNGKLVYVGMTINRLARQRWHATTTCKGREFEMIVIMKVQSAFKSGAIFGAGWQEKRLLARLTEKGIKLWGKEQKQAEERMTSEEKDTQFQRTGRPIVTEGMMTIKPAHGVAEVKNIFRDTCDMISNFYFLILG